MKLRYLLAGVAAIVASPAAAQDTTTTPNAALTGPRIEARVGYDNFDTSSRDGDEVSEGSINGVSYGGEVGFDLAVGGGLIGAYGGAELSTGEECDDLDDIEVCVKQRRNFTAGVRGGFLADERVLLYVKGGYSNGKLKITADDGFDRFSESDDRSGYHIGGGVEGAITENIYAKLEYVYTKYKSATDEDDVRSRFTRDQFVLGVGFRF